MADRRRTPARTRILLGFGLDSDGHARVTKGEDFVLVGGTEHTHGRMQDGVERFHGVLEKMGTDLQNATLDQMAEAAHESGLHRD